MPGAGDVVPGVRHLGPELYQDGLPQGPSDRQESVNPQFEIERARNEIANLQPAFDQNKETLARAEVAAEHLEREINELQANLDHEKTTILALRDKIKSGDVRLTGRFADTAEDIKAQLINRKDHYDYTSGILKEKHEVLKAKKKTIEAAHKQLETLRAQKFDLARPAGSHRGQAPDDRGHPGQERVQLR